MATRETIHCGDHIVGFVDVSSVDMWHLGGQFEPGQIFRTTKTLLSRFAPYSTLLNRMLMSIGRLPSTSLTITDFSLRPMMAHLNPFEIFSLTTMAMPNSNLSCDGPCPLTWFLRKAAASSVEHHLACNVVRSVVAFWFAMPRTPPLWQRDFFLVNCLVLRRLLASERSGVVKTFRWQTMSSSING